MCPPPPLLTPHHTTNTLTHPASPSVFLSLQAKYLPPTEKGNDSPPLVYPEMFAMQWVLGKHIRTADEVDPTLGN